MRLSLPLQRTQVFNSGVAMLSQGFMRDTSDTVTVALVSSASNDLYWQVNILRLIYPHNHKNKKGMILSRFLANQ